MENLAVTCIAKSNDRLGEGCLWDDQRQILWWVDIPKPGRIHQLDPATGAHRSWSFNRTMGSIALRGDGSLLVAADDGLYFFDVMTGALTPFVAPEATLKGNRSNDGACDPAGRYWHGTMMNNIAENGADLDITADTGQLHRIDAMGRVTLMQGNIGVSNGPCWSPEGDVFYFSDSKNQMTWAYDFDVDSGEISNQRVFNDTKDYGYPDGATVDAEGYVWSARWEGHCLLRLDPKGRIDRVVAMPASRPTCVVFGGPKLDTLFVTTSKMNVDSGTLGRYPLQGSVFCFNANVRGTLKYRFAG